MDIQHFRRLKLGFVLPGVDAIDRADIDTRRILRANARFTDDIGHARLLRPTDAPGKHTYAVPSRRLLDPLCGPADREV
jgi:hypothetical protein